MLRWQESSLSASGNNPTGRENLNPRVSNSKGLDLTSFAVPPSQLRSKTKLKSPWGVCKRVEGQDLRRAEKLDPLI